MRETEEIERFQSDIDYELKNFKDCMKTVKGALETKERSHILTKMLEGKEVDYIGELLGNTDFSKIIFKFPEILELSFFITFYAFLENRLIGLCEILRVKRNYSLKISDIKGGGIIAAQTYIKKLAKLPFPDQSSHWHDICIYRHIRNCIVHRDGKIADKNKELEEKIKKFRKRGLLVDLTSGKHISLSKGFCSKFVNIMEDFLKELFKGIINETNRAQT